MKVKELIEELSKYDDYLEVVYVSEVDYTDGEISYVELYECKDEKKRVWLG